MKTVLQNTLLVQCQQHVKIKNLYYNKHFKPLMCITLGSDNLRLRKLYYKITLLAHVVLNNMSRLKT